jgi:hypothetical protein
MGSRLAEPYGGCRIRDPGARLHPPPIDHVEEVRTCATNSSPRSCCGRREPPPTPKPVNGQHRTPAATAESCICCAGRRDASGHRTGRASRARRPGPSQRHLHPRGPTSSPGQAVERTPARRHHAVPAPPASSALAASRREGKHMHNQHAGLSQQLAEQRITERQEQAGHARLAHGAGRLRHRRRWRLARRWWQWARWPGRTADQPAGRPHGAS